MTLNDLAVHVCDSVGPILLLLVAADPLLPRRRSARPDAAPAAARDSLLVFWLRSAAAIAIAVLLAEAGKHFVVWPGRPSFPSGHTTFAAAAAACVVLRRGPRWLAVCAPLVAAIGIALVYAGWHRPEDIAGGVVLGVVVPAAMNRVRRRHPMKILDKSEL